jgi:hypothetical protein
MASRMKKATARETTAREENGYFIDTGFRLGTLRLLTCAKDSTGGATLAPEEVQAECWNCGVRHGEALDVREALLAGWVDTREGMSWPKTEAAERPTPDLHQGD